MRIETNKRESKIRKHGGVRNVREEWGGWRGRGWKPLGCVEITLTWLRQRELPVTARAQNAT